MIAPQSAKTQVLVVTSANAKIHMLNDCLQALLRGGELPVPAQPGRDVQILPIRQLPPKKGLSTREGQARLLHDLASIELQAMELGVRTLAEFGDAPAAFRQELAEITAEEADHLRLCFAGLDELGFPWGSFPTHLGLWQAVSAEDCLLDRILIVHRYLEGSGLDASDKILRRLQGVGAREAITAVEVIRREEVGHVRFGSRWYHALATEQKLDPADDFGERLDRLCQRLPRRLEPIQVGLRAQAGFSPAEIRCLERLRDRQISGG